VRAPEFGLSGIRAFRLGGISIRTWKGSALRIFTFYLRVVRVLALGFGRIRPAQGLSGGAKFASRLAGRKAAAAALQSFACSNMLSGSDGNDSINEFTVMKQEET
jgi:hypothetical protein